MICLLSYVVYKLFTLTTPLQYYNHQIDLKANCYSNNNYSTYIVVHVGKKTNNSVDVIKAQPDRSTKCTIAQ